MRVGASLGAGALLGFGLSGGFSQSAGSVRGRAETARAETAAASRAQADPDAVTVDQTQAHRLKIEPIRLRQFHDESTTVGRIAFNDERTTAIFAPFQGRVLRLIAKPGDVLRAGSTLLVINSPDLVQATANLITASVAVRKAQNQMTQAERVARRQKLLYEPDAGPFKDLEQAESDLRNAQHDLQTAEGQRNAARNRLRMTFGKNDGEIARIETTHDVDRVAQIMSPIAGTVTARKVSPRQVVRADNTDPMFSVAGVSLMWLVANVAEIDIPRVKIDEEVVVQVMTYPREIFRARLTYVGASVDPTSRRLTVRAEIANPEGRLKPDMFASFRIMTGVSTRSPSVPTAAVLREATAR
jgi:cobalt-zinc-cadmium efflux system membrane fusion protein